MLLVSVWLVACGWLPASLPLLLCRCRATSCRHGRPLAALRAHSLYFLCYSAAYGIKYMVPVIILLSHCTFHTYIPFHPVALFCGFSFLSLLHCILLCYRLLPRSITRPSGWAARISRLFVGRRFVALRFADGSAHRLDADLSSSPVTLRDVSLFCTAQRAFLVSFFPTPPLTLPHMQGRVLNLLPATTCDCHCRRSTLSLAPTGRRRWLRTFSRRCGLPLLLHAFRAISRACLRGRRFAGYAASLFFSCCSSTPAATALRCCGAAAPTALTRTAELPYDWHVHTTLSCM